MLSNILYIVILVVLLMLSAFFSASETALITISPHRLRTMVEEHQKNAEILEKVLSQSDKMLSVILICNNIVNLGASSLATVFVQNVIGSWAVSIGTGVLTLLVLVFGEITPKTISTYNSNKIALKFAPYIRILMIIFTPIAAAINFLANGVIRLLHVDKSSKSESYTENEIRSIVEVSEEEGVIESGEKDIINNVFDFTDTIAREAMVPIVNVTSVSVNSSYKDLRKVFADNLYTRIPVFNEDESSFIGMINLKDFIFMSAEEADRFDLKSIMRELPYTYEQKHLAELFLDMKKKHTNMMAVMDEYGVTVGIITMEDLLEEIVGDIRDEYDEDEEDEVLQEGTDEYVMHGSTSLSDINSKLGTALQSEAYDSIGGLIIEKLDRLPEEGDTVNADGVLLTVDKVDGPKIEQVRIKVLPKEEQEG